MNVRSPREGDAAFTAQLKCDLFNTEDTEDTEDTELTVGTSAVRPLPHFTPRVTRGPTGDIRA